MDGKYEQCPWPAEDGKLASMVDGGDGCAPLDKAKFAGKTAVVTSVGCSQACAGLGITFQALLATNACFLFKGLYPGGEV